MSDYTDFWKELDLPVDQTQKALDFNTVASNADQLNLTEAERYNLGWGMDATPEAWVKAQLVSNSWVKHKEIQMGRSGTVSVAFTFSVSNNYVNQARLYKNGTAVGTLRSHSVVGTPITYTENIKITAGDKLQVYCYTPNAATLYISRLQVMAAELPETACVTMDTPL